MEDPFKGSVIKEELSISIDSSDSQENEEISMKSEKKQTKKDPTIEIERFEDFLNETLKKKEKLVFHSESSEEDIKPLQFMRSSKINRLFNDLKNIWSSHPNDKCIWIYISKYRCDILSPCSWI